MDSKMIEILAIAASVLLGVLSVVTTIISNHGRNIIAVTTNYRMKRFEKLKECGQDLMSNTVPEILKINANNLEMVQKAFIAAEAISMLFYRSFEKDRELIELSAEIADLAFAYNTNKSEEIYTTLTIKRKLFKIKCNIYNAAEWGRIKQETKGRNTKATTWEEDYKKIEESYRKDLEDIEKNSSI